MNILSEYINKNPDKVYEIHHRKMEELVGAVFGEHYSCEVHHVGRAVDGGKDLILVESDKTIIVQVKRRTMAGKTEGASSVRELIATTLLTVSRDCIFVTTADHFSKQAISEKDTALTKSIIDSYELFDRDKFLGVLDLVKKMLKSL
ncbi:restriction endonuclease [Paenibacillus peoriae]|uniref:restriction endonuclease n=1 Tax=Paenibacillus peoriae TaxID=59893 RepID=UPI002811E97A|nr:restriction endonuclease [Paenibacillus peoriae]